jgi:large subunit ribosomal protein L22
MAQYKYSTNTRDVENISKAVGRDLEISTKQAIEVCNFIKKKKVDEARAILEKVISKKMPIAFKRFTEGAGHKRGIGAGKYPIKCCEEILRLLNQTAANASFKGLNPSNMVIKILCPQKAAKRWHYGRQRRRMMKRTNLEIVLEEQEEKKSGKKTAVKKEAAKSEVKKVEKKEIKKGALKAAETKQEAKKE